MGSSVGAATAEQNEAASAEAVTVFEALGVDANEGVSLADWERAFVSLDTDGDGVIKKKDWFTKLGTTLMYDAVSKQFAWRITKAEWGSAFNALEPRDGKVSVAQWLGRRKVRLGLFPLKFGIHSWGVGVGADFYEVASVHRECTEMAAVGPRGIIALGEFAQEEGGRERWLGSMQEAVKEGRRHERTWLEEEAEPRSRPQELADRFEDAGWTLKNDEQIEAWISQWVAKNPRYRAIDPVGRECNEQTFAVAFISFLIGSEYKKMTCNTKGRAVVYGGLALLAGVGVAAAIGAVNKNAKEAKDREKKRQDSIDEGATQTDRPFLPESRANAPDLMRSRTKSEGQLPDHTPVSTRSPTNSEASFGDRAAPSARLRAQTEGMVKAEDWILSEDPAQKVDDTERRMRELEAELALLRMQAAAKDSSPPKAAPEHELTAAR